MVWQSPLKGLGEDGMFRHGLFACVSLFAIAGAPGLALAQDGEEAAAETSADTVGEVVVTARRREEKLSDVPVAASVIGAEALADRGGATSALDLLAGQPSVRFFNTTSPVNSEISIRASPTARATASDPSVGLYRNGSYIGGGAVGGRSFTRLDLFDIGRVEILRGTQGALYGRNAVGGAANVVSAKPVFENTGWIDARYATETENTQLQAVANLAISEDIALRLGIDAVDQKKGFFYNRFNDVYFDHQESVGVRGQLRWRGERADVNLLLEHAEGDIPAITYRVVIAPGPGFPLGIAQPKYEYNWSLAPIATQSLDGGILSIDYRFDWATLSLTSTARRRTSFYQFDPDGTNQAQYLADRAAGLITVALDTGQGSLVYDTTDVRTTDIHLAGDAIGGRLDWLAGVEVFDLTSNSTVVSRRTPTVANTSLGTRSPALLEYKSWAVYGSLGFDITETLNIVGEARYTSDEKSIRARRFDFGTGAPSGGAAFVVDDTIEPTNTSYNLIGSWRTPFGLLAYGKVGTSYRSGGFNSNLGLATAPNPVTPSYDDETSLTWEAGLKGNVTPSIFVGLAAYRTETDNLIVQTDNGCAISLPACPTLAVSYLINAGMAESWGVEAEAVGRFRLFGGDLRLSASLSRQEGEVTDGVYKGEELAQVPEWIAGADINYRRPFIGDTAVFFNINWSGQWGGVQELIKPGLTTPNYDLADMSLVNGRVGIDIKNVQLSLFVTNATDEEFSVFNSATTERLNTPRNWGVQLRYRW